MSILYIIGHTYRNQIAFFFIYPVQSVHITINIYFYSRRLILWFISQLSLSDHVSKLLVLLVANNEWPEFTSPCFPHSWLVIGFVRRVNTMGATRGVGTTYPSRAHEFTPVFSGVRVCPFSFGHCIVCPSSIYGFWLPIWYLQILPSVY